MYRKAAICMQREHIIKNGMLVTAVETCHADICRKAGKIVGSLCRCCIAGCSNKIS
jgi:hypothetical protein